MTRKPVLTVIIAAALAAAACVTINVYFPAAAIKDLSKQIEEEVRKEAATQQQESTKPGETAPAAPQGQPAPSQGQAPGAASEGAGTGTGALSSLLGITPAYAQAGIAQPEISNPAIRKIIESRAARVAPINDYKARGVIGENNGALIEARSLDSLPDLKARAEVGRLVKAENTDREELFREIAAAKKVAAADLPKIRETYASTLREQARPGDWIQMPDGAWKQK